MSSIRAIRGMSDILPEENCYWQFLETRVRRLLASHGYAEMRLPVVEQTALFRRSIGEVTDIVEKEMYTFEDRNGESLTLRPEGTAGCVRAVIQNALLGTPQRLWYSGPMFRYERPQKGRQRQFHQIGVEAFGIATPDMDAELIAMTARLWQRLGLASHVRLELNSIGSGAARQCYRDALVSYLSGHRESLDEDSQRRLESNPLRILDSKDPNTREILAGAPILAEYLDDESRRDFARLTDFLEAAGVAFEINPRLVRGLDYYNKTVFEWVTDSLGAQGTVCAGGRYDGLVEQLGGKPTPGVGFAMGLERLVLLLQAAGIAVQDAARAQVYAVCVGEAAETAASVALARVREALPDLRIVQHMGGGSFRSQMKKADRSGANHALIWGDDEVASDVVTLKALRGEGDQRQVPVAQLVEQLAGFSECDDQ